MAGHTGRAHSALSPSAASRWTQCPGSVRLLKAVPKKTSTYAGEGTAAHELAEKILASGELPNVGDEFGSSSGYVLLIDQETLDNIMVYVMYVQELRLKSWAHWTERPTRLGSINPPANMDGTADFVAVSGGTLHVVDLKWGKGVPVEVEGNLQGLQYALGTYLNLKEEHRRTIKWVSITIVQPRAAHRDGPVRRWTIPIAELFDYTVDLMEAAKRALAPDAPLKVGSHCRWCDAAGVCPEAAKQATLVAQSEFAPAPGNTPPPTELLSPAEIGALLTKFEMVENWMNSVRQHAMGILERGGTVPGWKAVEKRATRKWSDVALLAKWGQDHAINIWSDPEVMSPAQLEKSLGKEGKDLFPADLVTKQSSGLTLAEEWDKRPAAIITPATEEFSVVDQLT